MDSELVTILCEEFQIGSGDSRAPQFKAGIDAIHALGRCLAVTSDPRAALVSVNADKFKLGDAGNTKDRLPVQVLDCAHVGLNTFIGTQNDMENVKSKAQRLMMPLGPINKIISCLSKEMSPQNATKIKHQEEILQKSVVSIKSSLKSIENEWENWESTIKSLEHGSECQEMHVADMQEKTRKEIKAIELTLAESEKKLDQIKLRLDELQIQQQQAEKQYQESLDKLRNRKDGWLKSWFKLKSIRKEIELTESRYESAQAQCLQQRQTILNIKIQELQLQASKSGLDDDLKQLEHIRAALTYACGHLRIVIASIKTFVSFFYRLTSKVDELQDDIEELQKANPHEQPEITEEDVKQLREEAMEMAVKLRSGFYVIGFTAHTYGIISADAFMPGISYVYGLGTTFSGDIDAKKRAAEDKLDELKIEGHKRVEALCNEREAEAREKLEPMIKQICASTTRQSITWVKPAEKTQNGEGNTTDTRAAE